MLGPLVVLLKKGCAACAQCRNAPPPRPHTQRSGFAGGPFGVKQAPAALPRAIRFQEGPWAGLMVCFSTAATCTCVGSAQQLRIVRACVASGTQNRVGIKTCGIGEVTDTNTANSIRLLSSPFEKQESQSNGKNWIFWTRSSKYDGDDVVHRCSHSPLTTRVSYTSRSRFTGLPKSKVQYLQPSVSGNCSFQVFSSSGH